MSTAIQFGILFGVFGYVCGWITKAFISEDQTKRAYEDGFEAGAEMANDESFSKGKAEGIYQATMMLQEYEEKRKENMKRIK